MDNVPNSIRPGPGVISNAASTSNLHHRRALPQGTPEFEGKWYILSGYCDLLDRHPIPFRLPLPGCRICVLCQEVVAKLLVLCCGHNMCERCRGIVVNHFGRKRIPIVCPEDGVKLTERGDQTLLFSVEHLLPLEVYCPNMKYGCTFRGELSKLRNHYRLHSGCHSNKCDSCRREPIGSGVATAQTVSLDPFVGPVLNVMREVRDLLKDLMPSLSQALSFEELKKVKTLLGGLYRLTEILPELPMT